MPRLKGSADLLEDRRKRALALLDSGYSLNEVGRRIGCNPSSVMRWRNARQRGGAKALQVRFSPGRPLKLDRRQRRASIETDLHRGAWIDPSAGKVTFGEWAQSWLDARADLRPVTKAKYQHMLDRHVDQIGRAHA